MRNKAGDKINAANSIFSFFNGLISRLITNQFIIAAKNITTKKIATIIGSQFLSVFVSKLSVTHATKHIPKNVVKKIEFNSDLRICRFAANVRVLLQAGNLLLVKPRN